MEGVFPDALPAADWRVVVGWLGRGVVTTSQSRGPCGANCCCRKQCLAPFFSSLGPSSLLYYLFRYSSRSSGRSILRHSSGHGPIEGGDGCTSFDTIPGNALHLGTPGAPTAGLGGGIGGLPIFCLLGGGHRGRSSGLVRTSLEAGGRASGRTWTSDIRPNTASSSTPYAGMPVMTRPTRNRIGAYRVLLGINLLVLQLLHHSTTRATTKFLWSETGTGSFSDDRKPAHPSLHALVCQMVESFRRVVSHGIRAERYGVQPSLRVSTAKGARTSGLLADRPRC